MIITVNKSFLKIQLKINKTEKKCTFLLKAMNLALNQSSISSKIFGTK